ncbi:MAG TPA: PEGA domain-containing protein [Polyangiaceae bacterium]|jgi:hypothetical protein
MRFVSWFAAGSLVGALAAPLTFTQTAHAQTGGNKVAAEALFEDGRRLMSEGKAADACPKFVDSQRLDPSPGTLLNLASCYERTSRPATAWATYREAASAAAAAGRQDLVATAQRHAESLASTLPRLNVTVAAPVDGMTVKLDGVDVGRGAWGAALPVDPGEHTLDAAAPQYKPWSTKVTIGKEATTTPVAIPALEAAPAPPPEAAAPATTPAASTPGGAATVTPPGAQPGSTADVGVSHVGRTQRTIGIVTGAVGVMALGAGGVLAAMAKSDYTSSLDNCSKVDANQCYPAGVSQRNTALDKGNAATALFVAGGVALAAGVVIWITAPTGPSHADAKQGAGVALVPTLGGAMVSGRW